MLYLAVEDIDHTQTKARSPQTNGSSSVSTRPCSTKFYRVALREKIYATIHDLQVDLDTSGCASSTRSGPVRGSGASERRRFKLSLTPSLPARENAFRP